MTFSQYPASAQCIAEMTKAAEENMQQLKEGLEHTTNHTINIDAEIRIGAVIAQLNDYCRKVQPSMLIMGPHRSGAAERLLFGSNTLAAMRKLDRPLIIIPEGTRFAGIDRIGLACDLRQSDMSMPEAAIRFILQAFHPQLYILHTMPEARGVLSTAEMKEAALLKETLKEARPIFHFMQHENKEEAIREFAEKNNLDLLMVIQKTHDLLNGLFHKSQSKDIVLHAHIPVMSVHE